MSAHFCAKKTSWSSFRFWFFTREMNRVIAVALGTTTTSLSSPSVEIGPSPGDSATCVVATVFLDVPSSGLLFRASVYSGIGLKPAGIGLEGIVGYRNRCHTNFEHNTFAFVQAYKKAYQRLFRQQLPAHFPEGGLAPTGWSTPPLPGYGLRLTQNPNPALLKRRTLRVCL